MASQVPVNNETVARLTRTTSDGRELFYNLRVIQQPEQARACGSGAKCKSIFHPRGLYAPRYNRNSPLRISAHRSHSIGRPSSGGPTSRSGAQDIRRRGQEGCDVLLQRQLFPVHHAGGVSEDCTWPSDSDSSNGPCADWSTCGGHGLSRPADSCWIFHLSRLVRSS